METWPRKELWKSLEGVLLLLCRSFHRSATKHYSLTQIMRTAEWPVCWPGAPLCLRIPCRLADAIGALPTTLCSYLFRAHWHLSAFNTCISLSKAFFLAPEPSLDTHVAGWKCQGVNQLMHKLILNFCL